MVEQDLIDRRLESQRLIHSRLRTAAEVVTHFGAVQAQDYPGAIWGVGQRTRDLAAADVDGAFARGDILRTHILRPTWHFVAAADLRWLLKLSAPRVHVKNAFVYRYCELDTRLLSRTAALLARALEGKQYLTRPEVAAVLRRSRISAAGTRMAYVMIHAELEGLICSGPMRGRQFTYALLDERVAGGRRLDPEESLAELTVRYFTSHGPATVRDYVWWSGLTVAQAKQGLELAGRALVSIAWDGRVYWSSSSAPPARRRTRSPRVYLLPNYDEALIAYRDRQLALDPKRTIAPRSGEIFAHQLMIDGRVSGGWTRTGAGRDQAAQVKPFRRLTPAEQRAVAAQVIRFARFWRPDVR